MTIRFKKLNEDAVMPTKAHDTDAGFDLTATSWYVDEYGKYVYGTGIAVEIPRGYCGLVFPRSSISKKDFLLCNSVGIIDADFRGEITFKFSKTQTRPTQYAKGERIGQLVIIPLLDIEFEEADELSQTERGTGGYGSTGN